MSLVQSLAEMQAAVSAVSVYLAIYIYLSMYPWNLSMCLDLCI